MKNKTPEQQKIEWKKIPFVKLVLAFLAGILPGIYFNQPIEWFWYLLAFLLLTYLLLFRNKKLQKIYQFTWINGIIISAIFALLGYQLTILKTARHQNIYFEKLPAAEYLLIKLKENPLQKAKSLKAEAEILGIYTQDSSFQKANGNIIAYFQKDSQSLELFYGDYLAVKNTLNPINEPANPQEFDYKQYLEFNNIYHQGYFVNENWRKIKSTSNYHPLKIASKSQVYFASVLEQYLEQNSFSEKTSKEISGIAKALILGYKADLSPDLVFAYSNSGAIHVLAVSGLHVGIIFMLVSYILKFLFRKKRQKFLELVLILLALWSFAMLTGLPASVCRATTMFSLVAIGKALNWRAYIYNTLAVTAFVLLLFDPFFIMQVGFQLSFLAVLGIVYFQPKIYNLLYFRYKFFDWLWSITCVSIAAQLITAPVCLLYFHQFPNYFFISNLIVIPGATGVLVLGLVLLFASFVFEPLAIAISFLLKYLIFALNYLVYQVQKLPFALSDEISIYIWEAWLLYFMVFGFGFFLIYKARKGLWLGFVSFFILIFYNSFELYQNQKQEFFVVYDVRKETAIAHIKGKDAILISSQKLLQDESRMLFHIKHHLWDKNIDNQQLIALDSVNTSTGNIGKGFYYLGNKRILNLNKSNKYLVKNQENINLDFLVLSENLWIDYEKLIQKFQPKTIILDGSNSNYFCEKAIEKLEKTNVKFHIIPYQGAFVEAL